MTDGHRACWHRIIARSGAGWPAKFDGVDRLCRSAGVTGVAQRRAELLARSDVELREHLAQVVLDRAGADEQLRADLGVRAPVDGEPGHLGLLCRELVARVVRAPADGLSGG